MIFVGFSFSSAMALDLWRSPLLIHCENNLDQFQASSSILQRWQPMSKLQIQATELPPQIT